ncbi:UNVERIFIED_CONTAM: Aspartyl protease AED1 [Sesamum radiatum]|uniref:Aspartyl protease AED1 n=1 Tax=Sesamum radiatum TaxID=300843 RepID=A0AAW2JSY8_SESRA
MLMALISSHLSIFTFLLFLSSTAFPFSYSAAQYYLKLPLLHKDPYPPTPSEALSADNHRLSTLFSALRNHPHPKLPVNSAASSGSGQYLVSLHLGTPPQRLLLVADTGSDLTWVSCSACRSHCSPRATFFPRHSATFSPYHCFDSACTLVPHPKKTPHCNRTRLHTPCRYEYSYSDGSITNGFFSRETTTFNSSAGKLSASVFRLRVLELWAERFGAQASMELMECWAWAAARFHFHPNWVECLGTSFLIA